MCLKGSIKFIMLSFQRLTLNKMEVAENTYSFCLWEKRISPAFRQ